MVTADERLSELLPEASDFSILRSSEIPESRAEALANLASMDLLRLFCQTIARHSIGKRHSSLLDRALANIRHGSPLPRLDLHDPFKKFRFAIPSATNAQPRSSLMGTPGVGSIATAVRRLRR